MKSEKGQSIVEFALVVPLLILLLFGIIDFGRTFHAYLAIDHAGREAARTASVGGTDAEISSVALANGSSIKLSEKGTFVISPSESDRESGENVTITITYPIDFLTPVIGNIVGSFDLTNITVMRLE